MIVNTTELEIIRSRQALMSGMDTKRPDAWQVFGYKEDPVFQDFLTAYERGGAAHGAVHTLLDKCWQQRPRIKTPGTEDVTPFEDAVGAVFKAAKLWPALRDLDRRNMIGRYAGLILRMADSKALSEPLERAQAIVEAAPVYEDQLRVTAWHADPASPVYGKPAMYQYRSRLLQTGDTQGEPTEWLDVHPSRVVIMAEGAVGSMFDGVPFLKAGYNALTDIEKISGGSAESYLKNSARALTFEYDKDASPEVVNDDGSTSSVREAHENQVRKLNSNIDAAIVTQGAKAGVLQTSTSDPTGAFQLAANIFSASVGLPFTILFGQQTGRLASDEDQKGLAQRAMGRQTNEITPVLEDVLKRLQAAGVLPAGEFEIEWPDLMAPGDKEKLEIIKTMAGAMREAFGAGVADLFTAKELRRAAGYAETPDA